MPIGAILGGVGAVASTASAANSLFGGGSGSTGGFSGGSSAPQAYIPQNQAGADTSYYNLANSMVGPSQQIPSYILPYLQAATQAQVNNPYALAAQGAANTAAGYGTGMNYGAPIYTPPGAPMGGVGNLGTPATGTAQPGSAPSGAGAPSAPPTQPGTGTDPSGFAIGSPADQYMTAQYGNAWQTAPAPGNGGTAGMPAPAAPTPAAAPSSATPSYQPPGQVTPQPYGPSGSYNVPGLAPGWQLTANSPVQGSTLGAPTSSGTPQMGGLAGQQQGASGALYGIGNVAAGNANLPLSAAPVAASILNTAFDPQSALYNRTLQQVTDQSNAVNSMYGLGTSPYGAGVTDKAISDFNINWENSQLGREQQGLQSYTQFLQGGTGALGNLANAAGTTYQGAGAQGQQALNTQQTAGALPYNTYNTTQSNITNALANLASGATGAYGLDQNTMNALSAYLKLGQSATGIGQAGAAQNFGQNQQLGAGLASSLSNLGTAFNNVGNIQSGSGFNPAQYSSAVYNSGYNAPYDPGNIANFGTGTSAF